MEPIARFIVMLLRAYKWLVSPLLAPACRYVPTCSEYAVEALETCGVWRGGAKAVWRLLRCHPFAKGGYDPVQLGREVAGCCRPARYPHLPGLVPSGNVRERPMNSVR
jgi:uncharacterized protein